MTIRNVVQNEFGDFVFTDNQELVPESLRRQFAFIMPESSDPAVRKKRAKAKKAKLAQSK
jgi:hypothetical protein